jgi:hypothetical protein
MQKCLYARTRHFQITNADKCLKESLCVRDAPIGMHNSGSAFCKEKTSRLNLVPSPIDFNLYYSDPGEEESLIPLKAELEKRSYVVNLTKDLDSHAEIGIYAVGANHLWDFEKGGFVKPKNRFSVIMLHDLAQDNGGGPDFFLPNEWSNFDLGILPNYSWLHNYNLACGIGQGVGPRFGCHVTGYPKFDGKFVQKQKVELAELLLTKSQLFSEQKPSILLASSWISTLHIEDLLKQIPPEHYNVLVKVPNYDHDFSEIDSSPWRSVLVAAREETFKILKDYRLDGRISLFKPESNIFDVLQFTSAVVSNGSNVIHEGMLLGIPSISVVDWSHPSGPTGQEFTNVRMDIPGCIDCTPQEMQMSLSKSLSFANIERVNSSAEELLPLEFRGKSTQFSVDVIEKMYYQFVQSQGDAIIERDSAIIERDSAIIERDSAIIERDSAIIERDSAIIERDSILNSGIWKATKLYRWLRDKF